MGKHMMEPMGPIDRLEPLTHEEEADLLAGLAELDEGKGIPLADVVREIRGGSSGS